VTTPPESAWRLRDGGLTVPWRDILIAAIAIHDDVRLYAVDQHFAAIAETAPLRIYRRSYGEKFAPDECGVPRRSPSSLVAE
jgi:hypothetical protein